MRDGGQSRSCTYTAFALELQSKGLTHAQPTRILSPLTVRSLLIGYNLQVATSASSIIRFAVLDAHKYKVTGFGTSLLLTFVRR